jgi:alkylation response protein AidB-like acyl-CoA dehydrogenase
MKLLAREDIGLLTDGFARVLAGAEARNDAFFAASHSALWERLVSGGWTKLGLPESEGGGDCDLRDLLEFCELWGRYIYPLPFVPTLLGERWGVASFAVGGLVPFGGDDRWAPSLPLGPGEGALAPGQLNELRACLCAEAVGAATAALESAVDYAGERRAYGQPIGRFQAIKHLLADMKRDVELARSAAVWAAQVQGAENARAAVTGLDLAQRAATNAIQVFAGIGFTWELELHFFVRHVMALRRLASAQS